VAFSALVVLQIAHRERANERLRASEERFALAVHGANDGIWDWNLQTHEAYISPRWKEIVGYRNDELPNLESSFFDLIHPDDKPRVNQAIDRHLENGEPYRLELRLRHKDGSYRWILARGEAVRGENGRPMRMVGSITDITERKRAEAALQESEERLRLALHAAGQGLYDLDVTTGDAKFNPEYAAMIGYDPATFEETNAKWAERLHPDDREKVYATYSAYIRGEIPSYEVEFRQKTKSGDWLWTLSIGSIVSRDANGKPLRMLGTHTDITARKRAERERSELLGVLESSLNEIYVFDAGSLSFRYVNAGALRNLGYTAEKIKTLTPLDLKPEFNETSFRALIAPLLNRQQEKLIFYTYHRRADASSYPVEVHLQLAQHQGQQVFFAVILDITERKRAEEQIKGSLQEKDTLLREIHHRVKNNLQIISSLLYLQGSSLPDPVARQALRESQDRVHSIGLVHEQLYRSSSFRAIDFGEHLKELTANIAGSYGAMNPRVRVETELESVAVDLDLAIPVSLIFNEILTNAFKHAFPGKRAGKIQIAFHRDGSDNMILRVSDGGVGLPENLNWDNGSSLGLKIVRNLAAQIHGELYAQSAAGVTTFQLSFSPTKTISTTAAQ
jgi:PAS domain S-box-containing protein